MPIRLRGDPVRARNHVSDRGNRWLRDYDHCYESTAGGLYGRSLGDSDLRLDVVHAGVQAL